MAKGIGKGKGTASKRVYRPKEYWHERGFRYKPNPRRDEMAHAVSMLRDTQPDSILDVGSGIGTLYMMLRENGYRRPIGMCDIADSMRVRACINTKQIPDKWNGVKLPYKDGQYDLVFSSHVMLHVPHDEIDRHMSEMVRVAKRYLYIATYAGSSEPASSHCFRHDYYKMFHRFYLNILSEHRFSSHRIAHWLLSIPK